MRRMVHDLLFMLPLCLLVTLVGEPYFEGPENSVFVYLAACTTLVVCVILRHWNNRLKYLIPAAFLVLGAGVLLTRPMREWGELLWSSRWLFLTIAVAVLSFFAGWLLVSSCWAERVFAALLFIGLILNMIFVRVPGKTAVVLAVFLLLLYVTDEIQRFWKKSGATDPDAHLVSVAPFLVVLALLVYLFPAPENPYDWNLAKQVWEKVTDVARWVGGLFSSEEDYDAVVGFSESGSFYGSLSETDETVMTLSGNKSLGSAVYLRGKVMDAFDGRSWADTYEEENRDDILDTLETINAVNTYDPEYFGNYLRRVELRLRYEEFNTRYLFAPLKAALRWNSVDELAYTQKGGNLIAEDSLGYGTEYAVPYYRMNRDHDVFEQLLRDAQAPDGESWEVTRKKYELQGTAGERAEGEREGVTDTSYKAYLAYRNRVRTYYLPEMQLSAEVQAYIKNITADAPTTYDKLSRIEADLSGFKYTDSPGVLPESITSPETFLDDFLLNKREGYCSYFATAFVLMARYCGIPARYVQGFQVTTGGDTTVEVKSAMSHAWPEAYIEGVGWIPFEPTPGHKYVAAWGVQESSSDNWRIREPEREEPEEPEAEETEEKPDEAETEGLLPMILISAGLLIALLLVFLLIDRITAAARYRRLDEEGLFRALCRKNAQILAFLGYRLGPGETLEEFYTRAGATVADEGLAYLRTCERIAYAGKPVDADAIETAGNSRVALLRALKQEKGRWYFWYRYRISRLV